MRRVLFLSVGFVLCLVAVSGTSSAQTCTPPPDGLVSWWQGEGDATDIGVGYHGTLVGDTAFAPGMVGDAFVFDGDGDYVEFGDVLNEITVPFSVEGWIKTPGPPIPEVGMGIFASDDAPYTESYHGFWLHTHSDNLVVWYGDGSGAGPGARRSKGSGPIRPLNTWTHVAGVVRGPTDMSLYFDGQDVGGFYYGISPRPMHHSTHTARLGIHTTWGPYWIGKPYYFNGSIDEFSVYDRALLDDEIEAIYQAGSAGKCFGLSMDALALRSTNVSFVGKGSDSFWLMGDCELGEESDGLDLLNDDVTVELGSVTATIPAGSFVRSRNEYSWEGTIDGADIRAQFEELGGGEYSFFVSADNVDLSGTSNPTPCSLTIGNDRGEMEVRLSGQLYMPLFPIPLDPLLK